MNKYKICLVGAFSVGKSSLVRRFVHEVFDDRYTTTLGVKIETKEVELNGDRVKLVVWDMEGADGADQEADLVTSRMEAYLQKVDGVLLVADGTRAGTFNTALRLNKWLAENRTSVPVVLLLNKADLVNEWQITPQQVEDISASLHCFTTSALSGENVERTFKHLAQILSGNE
jgi:small GTP-binding protein